ncbi:MAG: Na+/H+ antiporter NhaC family protein [Cutibacterium granulosum]|uniref:Na+/H+ antiporter family protein n=1 Tax=Cutibacterium granulosum TaxID=33011 RepID=UPI002B223CF4|nr:Na+/H+ antiporter NhaC family protein [Cutibacterium granulosum]MEA5635321.1 Na+/H+ antiporter NhaC family protein [Cutibacterium granulosum]MEA5649473.1 Na+/H+ antiporter NhaC family protein [Cutibacterium granulosum]MEA5654361.1 Na+/H+ antiporter NhaC family protein [Cutibacterium granulosum]MEA5663899.1 Na+/H+ antiporter NhaC family protein [Cutibacterium granulosum]MEA5665430.1 Na+/H+ antiporter NhaC family protein [Cutibacterium granulosum]
MNAVLLAVILMLVLAVCRVHVVIALFIGALVGGLVGGLGLDGTMLSFQEGLTGGAQIALSYALLGAFAMAVAHTGLPDALARWMIARLDAASPNSSSRTHRVTKWALIGAILLMSIMSQNLIPVHIAFIPLLIPPLLTVFNRLHLDRRAISTTLTFGLVTTYMFIPVGFGNIFLNDILLGNIRKAGMSTDGIKIMHAMGIPALGMMSGLLIALFVSYRKPRDYEDRSLAKQPAVAGNGSITSSEGDDSSDPQVTGAAGTAEPINRYRATVAIIAIIVTFVVQVAMQLAGAKSNSLLVGAIAGLGIILMARAVPFRESNEVFTEGMKMMAVIGFVMIAAQGFAQVMQDTGHVTLLVTDATALFGTNKALAAAVMLLVGLVVTMGIGSSFSTLPIIATIYVPLCMSLGFSPLATVAIVGSSGALGDAGSPASDSTLGPTAGLGADGQHDHIRDSVIPTFLHFNLPLLVAGWIAAMVL